MPLLNNQHQLQINNTDMTSQTKKTTIMTQTLMTMIMLAGLMHQAQLAMDIPILNCLHFQQMTHNQWQAVMWL